MSTSFDHVDDEFSVDVPESANALATASSQSMDKAHALKSQGTKQSALFSTSSLNITIDSELDNSLYISKLADINNKSSLQLTSNHTTTRQSASKSSAVRYFCKQLNSILDSKPPISRAKVQSITKSALAAAIYYKHVVCNIEKFIQRCKNEYKLSGIYLIDSIVRQSRHECGNLKDPFGPRFSRNIENTFKCMHECTLDDKRKVLRLLSLWQRGAVFPDEKINFLSKIIVDLCSTSLLDDSAVFVDTPDDDNLKRKDSNRGDGRYLLSKDRLSLKTKTQSRQSSTTDKETLKDCDESNDDDDKVQELDDALTSLHHAKKSGIDIKSLLVGKDGKLRNIDSSLIRQIHKLTAQLLNNEDVNPAKRRLDNSSPTTEQAKTKNHKNSSYDDIQIYNNVKRRDEFDRQGSGPMGKCESEQLPPSFYPGALGCSNFIQNQSQLHPSNSNYFGSISLSTHQPSLICAEDTDSMMIPSAQLNQQQMITDMRQQYQNAFPQQPQTFSNAFVQYQHYFPQRLESNELVLTVDGNLQQQPQMQLTTSSDIIDMRTLTSQPLNPYIAAAAFDSNQIPTLNHSVAAAAGFAQSTAITNNMSHIIHDRQQPLYQPINYAQSAGPLPPQSAIFPNDKDRISYNIMASQANSMQNQPNDMHASLSRIDADMFGNAHPNFAKASQLQYDFSQPPPNFIIKQPSQQYQHSENINEMNFNDVNNIVQQTNFKTDGTANRLTSKPLLPTPNFAHNILTVSTSSAADQNSAVNYKQTDIISDQMFHSAHPSSNMIASFQQNNKSCGATSAVNTSIVSHQQVFASSDDRQSDLMTIPDKDERQAVKNPAHLHAYLPEKQSVVESTEFTTNKVPDTAATIYKDHVSTINNNLAKDGNIHCSSTMLARSSSEFKTKPSHEKTSVLPMTNSSLRSSYNVPEQIIQPSNSTSWIDNQQIQHCNINNTLCNDERPRRLSLNQRIEAAVRSQQRNTTSSRKSHKSLFKDRSSERSTRKERGRTANSTNVISSYLTDDSRHHHYRKSINNESPPRAPISDLVQQFPAYDKDERHNHQHHHQHNHKHIRDERIRVDRSNQDNRHIRDDRAVCEQYTTPHEQSSDEHMSQNRHGDDDDERSVVEKQGGHQRIHQNERYNEDSSVDHHKEQPAFTDIRRSPTAEAQNRSVIRRKESSSSRHDQERERRHLGLPPKREGYLIVCSKTVFLGHLPKMINEINIKEDLERMGPIINITYIQPRGCAFVCFEHRRHAARCVEKMQKDMKIQGNTVKLCWAVNIGVKDKFDNAWDSKYGCTYIAIDENLKKLEASKIVALCEGGMLDEHGAPLDILKKVNDFKKAQIVKEEEEARSKAKAAVTAIGNIDPISGCSGLQLTTFTDKVGTMQNSNGAMTMMTGAKQHTISQISAIGAAPLPHPPLPPILMRPVNPSTNIDSSSTAAITMTPSMDRTFTNAGGLAIQSQNQQSLISHPQFGQIHFAAQNSESLQQPHAIITSPFKAIIPPPTTLGSGVVDGRNDAMPTIGHIGGMQVNFTGQVPVHNPHPVIFNQRQWVVGHLPTITARPPPFANIVDIGKAFPTEAALPNNSVAQNAWQCVQRYPSNIPPLPIDTSSNNNQENSSTGQQCDNHSSKAISDVHKRPESAETLPSKRHVSRFNRSTANPDIHQRKPTDNLPITFSSEKVATAASVSNDFVDMTLNDKNTTVSSNITANDFRDSEHVNAQKLNISQTNVDMVNNDEEDKYTCIKEYGDNLTDNTYVSSNSGTALKTAATNDHSNENRKNNRKEENLQISSDCDGSNRNQNSIQDGGHQHRNSLKLPQSPLQKSLHSSQLSTVHHYTYESALEQSPLHRSLFEQQNKGNDGIQQLGISGNNDMVLEMHPPQSQHQRPLISTAPPTNDYQYNYNENVAMSNINQQGIVGERDMSYFEYGRDDFGPYRPGPPQPMRPPTALSPIRQNYCWQQPQPYYQPRHRNEFSQQMNCNSQIPSTRYGQPIPPPLQYEACMRADFEPNNQYPYHQHTSRYIAPSIDTRFSYETNYHQQYNNISRGGTERYRWTPPNPNRYYNDFHRFRGVGGSIDADVSGGGTVPYPPRNGSNRSFRFNRGNQYHRHGPYPFPAHSHILTTPRSFTPATSGSPFVPTANIQYDDFNIKCTDQTPKAENQDNVDQQHIQTTSITEDHDGDNNTKCRRNDSATIHEANQNEYFTQQQHSDSSLPVCPSSTNQDMGNQNSDNEYHSVLYDDLEAKVLPTSSPSPKAPRCSPSIITTADTAAANRDNDCSNDKMCEARQQSCGSLETELDVSSAEQHEQPADKSQENFEIRLPNNDDHTKQETGPATRL